MPPLPLALPLPAKPKPEVTVVIVVDGGCVEVVWFVDAWGVRVDVILVATSVVTPVVTSARRRGNGVMSIANRRRDVVLLPLFFPHLSVALSSGLKLKQFEHVGIGVTA